jgi:hypothetical protein
MINSTSLFNAPNQVIVSVLFCIVAFISTAQPVSTFIKNYESNPEALISNSGTLFSSVCPGKRANKLIADLSDGSFIVTYNGKITSSSADENLLIIMRIDAAGNVLWERSQAEFSIGSGIHVRPTCLTIKDDLIYIAGEGIESPTFNSDTYVVKLNATGTIMNNVMYSAYDPQSSGVNYVEVPKDILIDDNNDIFISGLAKDFSQSHIYLLKLDNNLDFISQNIYTDGATSGTSLIQNDFEKLTMCEIRANNELYIFFYAGNYTPWADGMGILKIDNNSLTLIGNNVISEGAGSSFIIPQKAFYDDVTNRFKIITKDAAGFPGFLQLNPALLPVGELDLYPISANISGDNVFNTPVCHISAFRVESGAHQGYYICGNVEYEDNTGWPSNATDIKYFAKLDSDGNIQWINGVSALGAPVFYDDYNNIVVTDHGIYSVNQSNTNSQALTLVKTNFDGEMLGNCRNYDLTYDEAFIDVYLAYEYASGTPIDSDDLEITTDDPITISRSDYCGCEPYTVIITPSQSGMICANNFPISLTASVLPQLGTAMPAPSYSWSSPSGSFLIDFANPSNIMVNSAGTYTVTATTDDGCTSTATYTVQQSLPLYMDPIQMLGNTCDGIILIGDNNPLFSNYCWYEQSDPSTCLGTNINFSPNLSGTYCFQAEDGNNCPSTRCITVQVSPPLDVYAITPVVELCVGESLNMVNFNISSSVFEFPLFSPSTGGSLDFSGLIGVPCGIDLNLIYGWPPMISSIDFVASPCNIGTNTLSYTFTNQFGCSNSASMEIIVNDIPNGEIDPIDDINLCNNGEPIMITYQCNAGPGGISEIVVNDPSGISIGAPIFDPSTGIFDPSLAGPGEFTVVLDCINDCGIHTDVQTFTIFEGLSWHQTTKWSENREIVNDVITDNNGNVYVTGNKMGSTWLHGGINNDIELSGMSAINSNTAGAFVAKYDRCGNLLWGADIFGADLLTSNSIVVDEINEIVFITGNIQRTSTPGGHNFESATGAGATTPAITAMNIPSWVSANYPASLAGEFEHGYVAAYSMDDGAVQSTDMILGEKASFITNSPAYNPDNYRTDCRAITINESNGETFIGGMRTVILGAQERFGYFVSKYNPYNPTIFPIGFNDWVWQQQNDQPRYNRINDMDFRETSNTLHLIGEMNKKLNYCIDFSTNSNALLLSGKRDAFIGNFRDFGSFSQSVFEWRSAGVIAKNRITGKGVAVDDNSGWVYYTGSYKQKNMANPFDFNSDPFNLVSNPWATPATELPGDPNFFRSYHIGIDYVNETAWCDFGFSQPLTPNTPNSNVFGTDVSFSNEQVYFCGDTDGDYTKFSNGDPTTPGATSIDISSTNPSPLANNVYVFQTNSDDGSFGWINLMEGGPGSIHNSKAITCDNDGHSFVVGEYQMDLDVVFGTPASGPLNSSAAINAFNGFIVRGQNSSGELRNNADNSESILEDDSYILKIYPNPVNEMLYIDFEEPQDRQYFELIITNNFGQIVIKKQVLGIGRHQIDMSNMNSGMYHINMSSNDVNQNFKLIKQ